MHFSFSVEKIGAGGGFTFCAQALDAPMANMLAAIARATAVIFFFIVQLGIDYFLEVPRLHGLPSQNAVGHSRPKISP